MFHPASEKLAIVSYGKQHVCFWSSGDDGKLQKKMGLFEVRELIIQRVGFIYNLNYFILMNKQILQMT